MQNYLKPENHPWMCQQVNEKGKPCLSLKKGCTESDNPEDYEATLNPAMYDYCRKCQKEPDDLVLRTTIITHATKYVKELCDAYDMTEHEETLQRRAEYVRQWKRINKARAVEKQEPLPLEVF